MASKTEENREQVSDNQRKRRANKCRTPQNRYFQTF